MKPTSLRPTRLLILCYLLFMNLVVINVHGHQSKGAAIYDSIMTTRNPNKVLDILQEFPLEEVKSDSLKAYLYYYYGSSYGQLGKLDTSIFYLEKANQALPQGKHPVIKIQILRAYGNIYWAKSYFTLALDNYQQALDISNENELYEFQVSLLGNIAGVYARLDDYEKALEYALSAEEVSQYSGIMRERSHLKIGTYLIELGQYEEGIVSLNETIRRLQLENEDSIALGFSYLNKGVAYQRMDESVGAFANLTLAQTILEKIGYPNVSLYVELAQTSLDNARKDLAVEYLEKAMAIAGRIGDVTEMIELKEVQRRLAIQNGSYLEALDYQQEITNLKDSLHAKNMVDRVYELETIYETSEKEHQIQLAQAKLADQKRFQLYLATVTLLLFVSALVFYRNNRLKQKANEVLDSRNKVLAELNETKDRLFTIVSHDLKNPVAAFRNMTQGLVNNLEELPQTKVEDYLKKMYANATEVENQLNALLIWAAQQLRKEAIKSEPVMVKPLVNQVLELIGPFAEQRGVKLKFDIASDLYLIAHPELLKTVLRNLITNAIKFTEQGGEVEVEGKFIEGKPTLKVSDTGVGMNAEELYLLMNTEEREGIQNHGAKGTGLGFSLTKDIIKKLNGEIAVVSQQEEGTTFTLSFKV